MGNICLVVNKRLRRRNASTDIDFLVEEPLFQVLVDFLVGDRR